MKLPRPRCIWHPTTQVLSRVLNCSLTGAERRSERFPGLGEMSMITQQRLASINRADRDLYAREKVLSSAIIAADISSGWEDYLQIFDAFYADHVEFSDSTESGAIFGREPIRAFLFKLADVVTVGGGPLIHAKLF